MDELKTQQEENIRILLAGNEERMERMAREITRTAAALDLGRDLRTAAYVSAISKIFSSYSFAGISIS